jgi:signal transduction histidine kinase/ligand-binding sensor domain-containing protein
MHMKSAAAFLVNAALSLQFGSASLLAQDPSIPISQYGHTSWTARSGFTVGAVFAMAQTPDGYLWLGSEFGLFYFDGVRFVRWQPPAGEQRPIDSVYSLICARDGTLWIGTFEGLASWRDGRLTWFPEFDQTFVTSMLEDRNGSVWVGTITRGGGRLCAVRDGRGTCAGEDGGFGGFVWSLHEDKAGTLWVGADSGVWRWTPGSPRRYPTPGLRVGDLSAADDGQLIIGIRGKRLRRLIDEKIDLYPIRRTITPPALLQDGDVDSNKLLRDRHGALWIGTEQRGLVHVQHGRADTFAKSDGLSGDIICSLFEDREGNIWVSTSVGLDRFRELPVRSYSRKQGLPSDKVTSVIAATDGSLWLAAPIGLTRWKDGQTTIFRRTNGLPDDSAQSLFEDSRRRIWVFTKGGLAYSDGIRFVAVPGVPSEEVFSITGDEAGNLWLSGNRGLTHLRSASIVEHFPWSTVRRTQQAKVVLSDKGGVWLSFWNDGGVNYFKDGQLRASFGVADGLGKGVVPGMQLDEDGALWAATAAGISRIKDGHVATLTSANGLPCDTIHGTMWDDSGALWAYARCGLIRIARTELETWIAHPPRRIETTFWDAADGVQLQTAPSSYGPFVAKSVDGKLWMVATEGIQVIDPHRLSFNTVRPPVHIERLVADQEVRWDHVPGGAAASSVRLPPRVRDVQIDYAALSFVAPEKVRFRYRLDGQDSDWREVVNERHVQYSNLRPSTYRFRVIAANNSGVWNEQGDLLEFSIAPAYYQTAWFRALCSAGALGLLWAGYQVRVRQLQHRFEMALEARVSERTRIARELHDTLLQSFHGLLLRFQTVSHLWAERPELAKEKLDHAINEAARAITEGRNAVQGLRESTVATSHIEDAIATLGAELAAAPGNRPAPAFRVTVEGEPCPLHPILRDDIYKITAEALRNAFRHADATNVDVEIRYDRQQFVLRVQDNGKGFDEALLPRQAAAGHYGLPGMRERAALMGGTLTVWSNEGAGTAVELCIPSRTVYVKPRERRWLARGFAGTTDS